MPDGDESDFSEVSDFISAEPSFLEDGYGISGEQPDFPSEDITDWETQAWSRDNQTPEDFIGAGTSCVSIAGPPPSSGTWVLGSVGGTCQWINTTTCGA